MRKRIGLLMLVMSVTGVSAAQLPGGSVYLGYTYLNFWLAFIGATLH